MPQRAQRTQRRWRVVNGQWSVISGHAATHHHPPPQCDAPARLPMRQPRRQSARCHHCRGGCSAPTRRAPPKTATRSLPLATPSGSIWATMTFAIARERRMGSCPAEITPIALIRLPQVSGRFIRKTPFSRHHTQRCPVIPASPPPVQPKRDVPSESCLATDG